MAKRASRKSRSSTAGGGSPRRSSGKADSRAARQAERHSKTRRDHSSEIAEDYVELIAQLIREHGEARTVDIARRLGVSHVTVTRTIARLAREGLVRSEPYRAVFLTEAGCELAQRSEARHRLVVEFLRKLGVDEAAADIDAEGIEHHVSDATLAAIRRFVGHQSRQPGRKRGQS